MISIEEMESILIAAMRGATSGGTVESRVRSVFAQVQPLFQAPVEFQTHLFVHLDRKPAPLLLDRIWFGKSYDVIEPRPIELFQRNLDEHSFAIKMRVERVRKSPQRAFTSDLNELLGEDLASRIRKTILEPVGFQDVMLSDWCSSPDRLVTLHVVRVTDHGYSERDRALCSLIVHAVAPILDQHFARFSPSTLSLLTRSQLEALRAVLIREGNVNADALSKVFQFFGVTREDGLLARFVDRAVIEEIDELSRILQFEELDQT